MTLRGEDIEEVKDFVCIHHGDERVALCAVCGVELVILSIRVVLGRLLYHLHKEKSREYEQACGCMEEDLGHVRLTVHHEHGAELRGVLFVLLAVDGEHSHAGWAVEHLDISNISSHVMNMWDGGEHTPSLCGAAATPLMSLCRLACTDCSAAHNVRGSWRCASRTSTREAA